jgi:ATP-binding cassette subfamily B (MDR/TAP) protein 1
LGAGEVTTRITTDTNLLQGCIFQAMLIADGISEKVALSIHAIAMFFTAFIIAFIKQWKMTLVLICIIPALGIPIVVTTTIMQKHEKKSLDHYAEGATLAEEVISTVRVAHAFGTQERLVNKYDQHLVLAEKSGGVKSIVIAIQMFCIFFVIYAVHSIFAAHIRRRDWHSGMERKC